jgi:hypothetical protein
MLNLCTNLDHTSETQSSFCPKYCSLSANIILCVPKSQKSPASLLRTDRAKPPVRFEGFTGAAEQCRSIAVAGTTFKPSHKSLKKDLSLPW